MLLCPRITELMAIHNRTAVACMSVGANSPFPVPVTHLPYEQLVALATRGLLVVALPPGKSPTTVALRPLVLYRPLGPGVRNEMGGEWRGKVLSSPRWRRPSQSVDCLSQQLQRGGYGRKERDQRRVYLVRTSEECSRTVFEAHCVSNNHPFFFLFFLFFFLFLLVVRTFLAADHDHQYRVLILLLPRAPGEAKAGQASE